MTHPPAGPSTPTPPPGPRAVPLTAEQRVDRYRRQTGRPLTARQQRRIAHKSNKAKRWVA